MSLLAAAGAWAQPPEEKPYTLFMGADLAVGLDQHLAPVKNVDGSSWIVQRDGEPVSVPTRSAALRVRVSPLLKLTEKSVAVAGLQVARGYTFANDPMVRQTRALADSAAANSGYAAAANQANARADASQAQANTAAFRGSGGVLSSTTTPGAPGRNPGSNQFTPATSQDVVSANYVRSSAGADNETTGERNTAGFDAMDVEFDISTNRVLRNPYVVTMTRFRAHGAAAGVVQDLIYAKALDSVDSHPRHVHLNEGGFPLGFEPVGFQIHVYDHGEELATTVADKRVNLSRDEAFEYVRTSYESVHLHDTLPPVPALGHVSSDLPVRLSRGQYQATIYVRVSKDGLPDAVFQDRACREPAADPYLDALIRGLRFEPALDQGAPVAGVAAVQLRQLLAL